MPDVRKSEQDTPYKILQVTPFFPPELGGISTHVYNLSENLRYMGNKITIITSTHLFRNAQLQLKRELIRTKSIYLPGWPYPTLRSVSIPIDFGYVIEHAIKRGDYDLVHVHGHHYPISWITLSKAQKYHVPCVLTLHGMYALNSRKLGGESLIEKLFNRTVFRWELTKTDAVIGLTSQVTDYARTYGKESNRYYTISNGVNCKLYRENIKRKVEFRNKYNLAEDSTIILFAGRLEHVKGILEFARAIALLINTCKQNIEVVIVGDGTLANEVKRTLGKLKNVKILPPQPQNQIHEIYIAADIFVNPSYFEGLPITILEAMNALLHIVYTAVGGVEDILKPYPKKTLLENNTTEEIYITLSELLSVDSIDKYSNGAFTYAQTLDWKNVALATKVVYDTVKKE